ncbi:MAG: tetratricopeptide repeat protein [Bacteroidota bacterium]
MKNILISLLILIPFGICAQITVKGIVTEQNSGNKPVPGVQIKAIGTIPEQSDNAGLFQLSFSSKKPGDQITVVEISKKGYEIVNKDAVNSWLISNDPNNRKKIIMCLEGLIAQNTLNYYNISLAGLTQGYANKIKNLQEQRDKAVINSKMFAEQAKALGDQFNMLQKQLEDLSGKFAHENFDDCSAIHKRAFEEFKQGNIEEAIKILETVNSETEIDKAKQQRSKGINLEKEGKEMQLTADTIIQQNIKKMMFQADLYTAEFRFSEANKSYEFAVSADSTNVDNIFAYANFLRSQRQFDKAVKWYNIALPLAKSVYIKARIMSSLAVSQQIMNQINQAEINFNEALVLMQKLANDNPMAYNLELARIHNNLGNFQKQQNQFDKAVTNFEEALKIFNTLSLTDSVNSMAGLATTYNFLGVLMQSLKQYDKAETYLIQSLNLRRKLAISNSKINYPEVAKYYNNLGSLHDDMQQFNKEETEYYAALAIFDELAKTNPQVYIFYSATTLGNIASLQMRQNQYEKSEISYNKSITITRELAKTNPQVYNSYLANLLGNLSILNKKMGQYEKAENNLNEALILRRELAILNPQTFNYYIAITLESLGNLQNITKQFEKSESNYKNALIIYRDLAKSKPQVYLTNVANILNGIGSLNYNLHRNDLADTCFTESLKIYRELAKTNPQVYNKDVAKVLDNYAHLQFDLNHIDLAEASCTEAFNLYKEVAKANPLIFNSDLADCYGNISFYQTIRQLFAEAEVSAREGLSTDQSRQWIQTKLAVALLYQGKFEEAKLIYLKFKDQEYPEDKTKTYKDVFLRDLDKLISLNVTHPDVDKIRKLLYN